MSKVNIGDYVCIEYMHKNGTVIADRGGYVGRWQVMTNEWIDARIKELQSKKIKE